MRLEREARVLAVLSEHCGFDIPQVVATGAGWQLRSPVEGTVEPWRAYRRVKEDAGFAHALGTRLGEILASQHRPDLVDALAGTLPRRPHWPYPIARIEADLPRVVSDGALVRRCLAVLSRYESQIDAIARPVLTHGDLGLHNLALASDGTLAGVFDYDDAAITDHHADFRYLILDSDDFTLLAAAVAAYRANGGQEVEFERVALFNAASAIGFLADRVGSEPGDRPAGRTLAEDLNWTRLALERVS